MNILILKNIAAGMLLVATHGGSTSAIMAPGILAFQGNTIQVTEIKQDALDVWLDRLAYIESEGRERIKILDHNKRYSYGCLQFQMQTFKSYIKKYDLLEDGDSTDLNELIYDCGFQKVLARLMIEDDYSNWRNWYTSVTAKKLGFPPVTEKKAISLAEAK